MDATQETRTTGLLAFVVCAAALLVVVVKSAWLSSDAWLAFRSIDNLLGGHGLAWNAGERVQVFESPLWVAILTLLRPITRDFYVTSLVVSIAMTLGLFSLLGLRMAGSAAGLAAGSCVLFCSKAFVDYSTSGLETPLVHLAIALFLFVFLYHGSGREASLLLASLLASWAMLARMDTALLALPPLAYMLLRLRTMRAVLALALGFVPWLAWEAFSLLYYGSLVSNPEMARLSSAIPWTDLAEQGVYYLFDSAAVDPVTLVSILFALGLAFSFRDARDAMVGAGLVLYLAHVVLAGGHSLSGYMLGAPLVVAAVLVARRAGDAGPASWILAVLLAVLGYMSPLGPLRADWTYHNLAENSGIVDGRGVDYAATGLLTTRRHSNVPRANASVQAAEKAKAGAARTGKRVHVVTEGSVALFGYFAGYEMHVIDPCGITDPLLARLPAVYDPGWVVGHARRKVPEGYEATLSSGESRIEDGRLAEYRSKIALVTRGSILGFGRLVAVLELGLGLLDDLMDRDRCRFPERISVEIADIEGAKRRGTGWNQQGNLVLTASGLEVDLGAVRHAPRVETSLDHNDAYRIVFALGEAEIGSVTVEPVLTAAGGLAVHVVAVPGRARRKGYDRLVVIPVSGDGRWSVGHLRLLE